MSRTFLRILAINAVLQFVTTRTRAARADEEGAAEAMWLRYPVTVVMSALIWTLTISTLARLARPLRSRRS